MTKLNYRKNMVSIITRSLVHYNASIDLHEFFNYLKADEIKILISTSTSLSCYFKAFNQKPLMRVNSNLSPIFL